MNTTTFQFYVKGMHCASCVILIEDKLKEVEGVVLVRVDLADNTATVTGQFLNHDHATLARHFSAFIEPHGYAFHVEKIATAPKWNEFMYALPIALMLIAGFILLQKIQFVNLITGDASNLTTALIIGLIASISTCLAVVGGLVLSISANYAKSGGAWKPQALFHAGRLIGFFVLGGVIGALGKAFQLSVGATTMLTVVIGLVMIVLGINLLDIFPFAKKLQLALPRALSRPIDALKNSTHSLVPAAIGVLTFFLPCGFTQSMQIYTLSTGSFTRGAFTMFAFALGTLPVLALLSFGSFNIAQKSYAGIFYKTAGIIVIALAALNILTALTASGLIDPLFNF